MLIIVFNPCVSAHTDVTVEQAHDLISSTPGLIVVDVREPHEYCDARGHIPGALNYPFNSGILQARYEELPMDGPILVVCRSGGRSNRAANFLDSQGFSMVYDMMGGMNAWTWETEPCKYSGGHGTADDPYQIATAEDLMLLGETPEDYDKYFILTSDIDLDPNLPGRKVFDKAVIESGPIGGRSSKNIQFNAVFEGQGHTISHMTITGGSYLGLFGCLGPGARISNLRLEAVRVYGTGNYVGGLAGWNYGGVVTMSYSNGTVSGIERVGGLLGYNWLGNITLSYSNSVVRGIRDVGGLVGDNPGGRVTACYSTGAVAGREDVGGLVGNTGDNVTSSFWDTETSMQATSAGGTGRTTAQMQDINTYLDGGWDFVGEICNGTCDYWQSSQGEYPSLRYRAGESPVMPEGLGTVEQPYLIRDARDLGTVWFRPSAYYRLEASLDLSGITWSMAVVPWFEGTLSGNGYIISQLIIKGGSYLGLFGQVAPGATISNLGLEAVDVNGTGNYIGGLAGKNVGGIAMCYSTGRASGYDCVGGLVGNNFNIITTSFSASTVSGHWDVGGLVGLNGNIISNSYSTGSVTGSHLFGGFAGSNYGSISTSYCTGMVNLGVPTGEGYAVGGLVGNNARSINSSFWDIQTCGQATSAAGTGKTTAEMQTVSTFLEGGWDFMDETTNGTDDIWWILEGQDYPRLWWELIPEN